MSRFKQLVLGALGAVGIICIMAPTGGFPSRPSFQTVEIKAAASASNPTPARPPLYLNSARPMLSFNETDQAADARYWTIQNSGSDLRIDMVNDTGTILSPVVRMSRSGAVSTGIAFGNTTDYPAFTFSGATLTLGHPVPQFFLDENDGGVDNRYWVQVAQGEQLRFGVENDAHSVTTNWLEVDRTGTTVDAVNIKGTNVLVNGVEIGGGKLAYARLVDAGAGAGTVSNNLAVTGVTRNSNGNYTVTLSAGYFAEAPNCMIIANNSPSAASIVSVTATSVNFLIYTTTTGSANNSNSYITCMGTG